MSVKYPIVALTGSTGAGLSTLRHAFKVVFRRLGIRPAIVHGDAFRRYTERQFAALLEEARASHRPISWFGPECNHFPELEALFRTYSETGSGVLFYEGQHGGIKAETWTRRKQDVGFPPEIDRRKGGKGIDVARYVDLLIGVAPAMNLEWIQKIHRDCTKAHCTPEESIETILRRLDDYVHYIVPQFGLTDFNIQRMPLVDTSNPFIARDVPAPEECICVIHFRDKRRHDFPDLLTRIPGARMSRPGTLFIPGGKLPLALEVVCGPILEVVMKRRRKALAG